MKGEDDAGREERPEPSETDTEAEAEHTLLIGFDVIYGGAHGRWRVMLYAPPAAFDMPWNMVDKTFNVMRRGHAGELRFRDPTVALHFMASLTETSHAD